MTLNGKTADQLREEFYAALAASEARQEQMLAGFYAALAAERTAREAERQDFDARLRNVTREWGNYTEGEGRLLESEGVRALRRLAELGGMAVKLVLAPIEPQRKQGREYDGLICCAAARALVEIKRRVRLEHVQKLVEEQLRDFPLDHPELLNGCALYGAVAGATIDEDARALAEAEGLFVIRLLKDREAVVVNNEARPRANGNGTAAG